MSLTILTARNDATGEEFILEADSDAGVFRFTFTDASGTTHTAEVPY